MPPTPAASDVHEPGLPPRFGHRFVLAIAVLAVLFAWVPGLGLLLSATGLGFGWWGLRHHRRHRSASAWALALSALGIVLGAGFTAIYVLFTPGGASVEEQRAWEAFDREFEPPVPIAPDRAAPAQPPEQPRPPAPPQGPPDAP